MNRMIGLQKSFWWVGLGLVVAGCGGNQVQNSVGNGQPLSADGLGGNANKAEAPKMPDLGMGAKLAGVKLFAGSAAFNQPIERAPVDPHSAALLAQIGENTKLIPDFGPDRGIPYWVVGGDTTRSRMQFVDKNSGDVPYPIPSDWQATDASSHRLLILERDGLKLFEASTVQKGDGGYKAAAGTEWDARGDLSRKTPSLVDGAGLPTLPMLVRRDEISETKEISHALRFSLSKVSSAFVAPATRSAGTSEGGVPMGTWLRLKRKYSESKMPAASLAVVKGLKRYGMILSDVGADLALEGTPDAAWKSDELAVLSNLKATDFEVVVPPVPKKVKAGRILGTSK